MASAGPSSQQGHGTKPLHVVVIVMGDVGRSPRMQYHAQSLLEEGYTVSLVGYQGETLIPALQEPHAGLNLVRFTTSSPQILRKFLPLYFIWRLFSLVGRLMWALWVSVPTNPPVDLVLVQNPPAVPLLAVALLFCRFQGFRKRHRPALVIDWHNLGYSMLRKGSIQKLARWYERTLSLYTDGHLCVTRAMKDFLRSDMGIKDNISVLYDCPPAMFRPMSLSERHEFLMRMHTDNLCAAACPRSWYQGLDPSCQTLFTEKVSGTIRLRQGRPALVTSSTSWTEDEDVGVLLEALILLDERLSREASSLRILVVVTGKGPMKNMYERQISKLTLNHVAVQTLWLEPADYPRLLACADLGVSLHTSTSGLDLPMKVLDLFGCQVPVLALNFACLSELVQDGVNGRVFRTSTELAEQLGSLLTLEDGNTSLAQFSKQLHGRILWSENWKKNALPVLVDAVS
jgi:beta-1,4-mannosyltransferase